MDEVRQKLTQEERAHLRNLWENKDILHALGSALSHQQLILAQQALVGATDFNQVMHFRGQNYALPWVMSFLRFNHQEMKKADQASQNAEGE